MQYYYTNFYQSYQGQTRNIIYILNEEERLWLSDCIDQLIKDRDTLIERGFLERHYTKQGTLSKRCKPHPELLKTYWNAKDEEAIEFLKKLCFFGEFEESIMLDPTDYQLEGMVDKMLVKIYGRFEGKFANWIQATLEDQLDLGGIQKHMDYKRSLFWKMKKAGMIDHLHTLPYMRNN